MVTPERLTDEQLEALEAEWSNAWDGLDDTPMMPTSQADPAYGGREHRMVASAPRTIRALIAEVRALRRAGDDMAAAMEALLKPIAEAGYLPSADGAFARAGRAALAEWRRVRDEAGREGSG